MTEPRDGAGVPGRARDTGVLHDRRRPGRREVDPALIPLLRGTGPVLVEGEGAAAEPHAADEPVRDDLATSVGLARGLGLAGLVWVAVAALIAY